MTFIVDNYLWFIISGFVLLMITIGYYAEKTNFGKKNMKQLEKPTKVSEETDNIEIIEDNSFETEIIDSIPIIDEMSKNITDIDEVIPKTDVLEPIADFATPIEIDDNIDQNLNQQDNNISLLKDENIPDLISEKDGNLNVNDVNSFDNDIWKF